MDCLKSTTGFSDFPCEKPPFSTCCPGLSIYSWWGFMLINVHWCWSNVYRCWLMLINNVHLSMLITYSKMLLFQFTMFAYQPCPTMDFPPGIFRASCVQLYPTGQLGGADWTSKRWIFHKELTRFLWISSCFMKAWTDFYGLLNCSSRNLTLCFFSSRVGLSK